MRQSWHDLLFAHWPIAIDALRARLPSALELDTFDGRAWLGVVPFRMSGIRFRALPPLPGMSAFPELNLRTYVRHRGVPGVWFFTLEASSALAVAGARAAFHLPYHRAAMRCEPTGEGLRYSSTRTHRGAAPARLEASYEPSGKLFHARAGSLEHWLTERYCLFAATARGTILRADIHHAPWPLQPARARFEQNSLARAHGLDLPDTEPLLLFARELDVLVWWPARAS